MLRKFKRQTSKDFLWLIIDDGSMDNTKELIQNWIAEGLVRIRYHFQENQGMHGAHNTAYSLIDTELNVCIDSDDYMSDDGVEKIVGFGRKMEVINMQVWLVWTLRLLEISSGLGCLTI